LGRRALAPAGPVGPPHVDRRRPRQGTRETDRRRRPSSRPARASASVPGRRYLLPPISTSGRSRSLPARPEPPGKGWRSALGRSRPPAAARPMRPREPACLGPRRPPSTAPRPLEGTAVRNGRRHLISSALRTPQRNEPAPRLLTDLPRTPRAARSGELGLAPPAQ